MQLLFLASLVLVLAGTASYLTRRRVFVTGSDTASVPYSANSPHRDPLTRLSGTETVDKTLVPSTAAPSYSLTEPSSDVALSVLVADATDSITLGYLAGGSLIGAALGYELAQERGASTVDNHIVCAPSMGSPSHTGTATCEIAHMDHSSSADAAMHALGSLYSFEADPPPASHSSLP